MKVILEVCGKRYVLDPDQADEVLHMLHGAEVYDQKWHRGNDGADGHYSHHVFAERPEKATEPYNIRTLTTAQYNIYKMNGHPEDKR